MMKKTRFATIIALLLAFSIVLGCFSGCATKGEFDYEVELLSEMEDPVNDYNSNLFYVNNLEFEIADPTVIQITEGEEKGWFYVYGTSDEIGAHGIQCWRSKDLSHWETMGIALEPDHNNTWASENYWAPEIIYDENDKLYYLFYNAYNMYDENHLWLSVAYSTHPAGPFIVPDGFRNANGKLLSAKEPVYDVSENNPILKDLADKGEVILRTNALDASPFIDPETGDKYMYFASRQDHAASGYDGTHIYGLKMKDWFSPDYSTITRLTYRGYLSVEAGLNGDSSQKVEEGMINEGPFMLYNEGKYYLTFSKFGMHEINYRVMQAIADQPLGDFVKVKDDDGGTVVSTDTGSWGHIITAGHHCFIKCGNETFIAYHTYKDRNSLAEGRALAVDKIVWLTNSEGEKVMHTNGPTWSLQALPESVSGYKNLASSAKITASNTAEDSDVSLLNDEVVKYQEFDMAEEYQANAGVSEIKLSWKGYKTVRAIMIFNSYDYYNTFVQIDKIEMQYKKASGKGKIVIEDVPFDWAWCQEPDYEQMRPGGSSIVEFDEIPVSSITITVRSAQDADYLSLNEIVVLGKDEKVKGVSSFEEYSYTNATYGSAHIIKESETFGNFADEGLETMYGYDLSNDNGTEDAFIIQKSVGQQYAYFKDVYASSFYVEAEFTVTAEKAYMQDDYPKFGLVVASGSSYPYKIFYYVDAQNGYTMSRVGVGQQKLGGNDWDWKSGERLTDVDGIEYNNNKYVKLAILRVGKDFYFICDGKVVMQSSAYTVFNDTRESAVGILSFNTELKVTNYSITTDSTQIQQKVNQYVTAE